MLLTCVKAAQRCRSMDCGTESVTGKSIWEGASRWCSWFSFKQHLLHCCGNVLLSGSWGCLCGVEDPIESLRVVAYTDATGVLLVYYVRWRIFLTVYPEKEATDPKEVERQLRGLEACFKCVAADLCVWLNISCVAADPCCIAAGLCVLISWFLHNQFISRPAVVLCSLKTSFVQVYNLHGLTALK